MPKYEELDAETVANINASNNDGPQLTSPGGLVQSGGYMAKSEIESRQRQDASELVTEHVARRHASTGNDVGSIGYHAGPGAKNIYDSTIVGPRPAGGGFRKHEKP